MSSRRTIVDAGDVSVMPKVIVISPIPIAESTRRMTSIGHGEPAMIPVRRLDRSNSEKRGWSSSAMNIVGTPYSAVQRSLATASSVARGSKATSGYTMHAPLTLHARFPNTIPKQW